MSLKREQPHLFCNAAFPRLQVGVWQNDIWRAYAEANGEAQQEIFRLTQKVLLDARLSLPEIAGFIHGEGPGSILGIRLGAMAIRAWNVLAPRPVYAFRSLDLLAAKIRARRTGDFFIIAEGRKGHWNVYASTSRQIAAALPECVADLPGPFFYLPQRKKWNEAPVPVEIVPASLAQHADILRTPGLLRDVDAPEVFAPGENEYQRWQPKRHRADA